jgi:hypothetical protein
MDNDWLLLLLAIRSVGITIAHSFIFLTTLAGRFSFIALEVADPGQVRSAYICL